ncbi:MAG: c-type cytochrome [Kofleriaceae bacterium]|nr:MAG: c-type cytochrome [Kofleriaceae bacterium]
MPPLALPDDANRAGKVALGHALFFDKRLSVDGSRACYSCHMNENGTGGADPIAIGPGDKKLTRHSPVLWNLGHAKGAFYWDGRAPTLEAVAKGAWGGPNMAVGDDKLEAKAATIGKIKGYKPLFKAAFGDEAASAERVQQALAEYMRTIVCAETAYDKFAKGDKAALTEEQQRGLDVFLGKGQCSACHTPPHFSISMQVDGGVYFNAGVGTDKPEAEVDIARMKVTNNATDWAAFKVPSLRHVARSAPYFHDGSAATLTDAVAYMANGAKANKNLSALLAPKNLTEAEIADVVKFLESLDCAEKLEEPKLP